MLAADDGVFKADELQRTNVVDSTADGQRVTWAKRRKILDRFGHYESTGANLREAATPVPSRKFAGQLVHCRPPARLLCPASKIKLLNFFIELVRKGDILQIAKDFYSGLLSNNRSFGIERRCVFIRGEIRRGIRSCRRQPVIRL